MSTVAGGLTDTRPVDDASKLIAYEVQSAVENKMGKILPEYIPLKYRSQVVEGVQYYFKVQVGSGNYDYLVVSVMRSLQNKVSLGGYKIDQTLDGPILPFYD